MGKGDKRSFKGKLFKGSFGNSRRKRSLKQVEVFIKKNKVVKEQPMAAPSFIESVVPVDRMVPQEPILTSAEVAAVAEKPKKAKKPVVKKASTETKKKPVEKKKK